MIGYIKGKLTNKGENSVIIETGGIGYVVNIPDNSPLLIAAEGEDVKVFTQMIVREDDISLYGFFDKKSVSLFNKLITVSGIGAKAAMAILSVLKPDEVIKAITFGDVAMLTRANGVGKKSAERVILELGDKLEGFGIAGAGAGTTGVIGTGKDAAPGDPRAEAVDAMMVLGYSKSEAASAVLGVDGDGLTTEEYIKEALKRV